MRPITPRLAPVATKEQGNALPKQRAHPGMPEVAIPAAGERVAERHAASATLPGDPERLPASDALPAPDPGGVPAGLDREDVGAFGRPTRPSRGNTRANAGRFPRRTLSTTSQPRRSNAPGHNHPVGGANLAPPSSNQKIL
jgi:hypothetical protein